MNFHFKLAATVVCSIVFALAAASQNARAADVTFEILHFDVYGNTLLSADEITTVLTPFVGQGRVYGDVQKALEALERAYRQKGYGAVNVHVPEQEITSGNIRIDVTEALIGKVTVDGNLYYDADNILSALPDLKEGAMANLAAISENVQLANENPSRKLEVALAASSEPGVINSRVIVTDQPPQRFYLSYDNTGSPDNGDHRLGLAFQHANIANSDTVLTLAYTGSNDKPVNVNVDVYSLAIQKPFYEFGDSLTFLYGKSNISVPSVQDTGFGLFGKGDVASLRWNHNFARKGEYSSRLLVGIDYKRLSTRCSLTPGQPLDFNPPTPPIPSCVPYTVQPLSLTYKGSQQSANFQLSNSISLSKNLPTGSNYTGAGGSNTEGVTDRYSYLTGRKVKDSFTILRVNNTLARQISGWTLRGALGAQLSKHAVPAAEQFGLVGSTAVRGFAERAIAADSGVIANIELYSPGMAQWLGVPGEINALAFVDYGRGVNIGARGVPFDDLEVASAGVGLRYVLHRDTSFNWDAAQIVKAAPGGANKRGDWRSHFKLTVGF